MPVQTTAKRTATAWEMIGWDDGTFQVKGGRARYEAVMYQARFQGRTVKLARLEAAARGLREVSQRVEPDTVLEFDDASAFDEFCEEFGITPKGGK